MTSDTDNQGHQKSGPLTAGDLAPLFNLAAEYVGVKRKEARARTRRTYAVIALVLIVAFGAVIDIFRVNGAGITSGAYASVVPIHGPIVPEGVTSADRLITMLQEAFDDEDTKAIILNINSPGGTPAQSYMIYQYILDRKKETGIPVIATAEDAMTSGAYLVAMAADEVYAPPMAMVGSIGVKIESFGFNKLLERFDVERRVTTSGPNKSRFDPWLERSESDELKAQEIVNLLQNQFVEIVKNSRGASIEAANAETIFSGDYWVAEKAHSMGLIDGLMTMTQVLDHLGIDDMKVIRPEVTISDLVKSL